MMIGALVMMALAQAPAGPATLSGQVVDAEGRPAAGVEVLLSGWEVRLWGRPVLSRAKSDRDGTVPDRRSRRKGSSASPFSPGGLGLRLRRRGSPGRRSRRRHSRRRGRCN